MISILLTIVFNVGIETDEEKINNVLTFVGTNFSLFLQILCVSASLVAQKFLLDNSEGYSVVCIGFWVYLFVCLFTFLLYVAQFINGVADFNIDKSGHIYIFEWSYLKPLYQLPAAWLLLNVMEMFNFSVLLFINWQQHIR